MGFYLKLAELIRHKSTKRYHTKQPFSNFYMQKERDILESTFPLRALEIMRHAGQILSKRIKKRKDLDVKPAMCITLMYLRIKTEAQKVAIRGGKTVFIGDDEYLGELGRRIGLDLRQTKLCLRVALRAGMLNRLTGVCFEWSAWGSLQMGAAYWEAVQKIDPRLIEDALFMEEHAMLSGRIAGDNKWGPIEKNSL